MEYVIAPSHTGGLLVFDGDCGFCTKTARFVKPRLPDTTPVVPWQSLDLSEFGLTEADVSSAAYWIHDGKNHRGHLGIARAAIAMGFPYRLLGWIGLIPPFRWFSAGIYHIVAKYRYRLPGSTDACKLS
jgi:predicted DCC family thiol-disulfide oxidoreductase YuxK